MATTRRLHPTKPSTETTADIRRSSDRNAWRVITLAVRLATELAPLADLS